LIISEDMALLKVKLECLHTCDCYVQVVPCSTTVQTEPR